MSMVACVGATEDVPTARAPAQTSPNVTERSTEGSAAGLEEATPTSAFPIPEGPSITAVRAYEKILLKPDTKAPPIGIFRAGQTVPLKEAAPLTTGPLGMALGHCKGGWYAVKPRGYVCLGANSSLDPMDVRAVAAREVLPNANDPLPFRVGIVVADSPIYGRVPTREEQRKKEKGLDKYLASLPTTAPQKEIDLAPAGKGPSKAFQGYVEAETPPLETSDVAFESRKISIANEFDAEGRTWLVTPDMGLVPKDKVKIVRDTPRLKGVVLKDNPELKLPLGYAWIGDVAKLSKRENGTFVETGESYPRQSFVPVTGQLVRGKGGTYWETRDGGYVRNDQFTVIKQRTDRPVGVGKNDKWVHVRITWGTLVAYEGDTPVFATAISPGQDGVTERAHGHTTKRGLYSVGWKLYSADMAGVDKKESWAVDEVPFVAYYKDSYGLHGAWWHDDFGRPKSHGCVNLAPTDARWMWRWMDPSMPEGWYAVAAYYPEIKGTYVDIRP